jgi:hypothetical protein
VRCENNSADATCQCPCQSSIEFLGPNQHIAARNFRTTSTATSTTRDWLKTPTLTHQNLQLVRRGLLFNLSKQDYLPGQDPSQGSTVSEFRVQTSKSPP